MPTATDDSFKPSNKIIRADDGREQLKQDYAPPALKRKELSGEFGVFAVQPLCEGDLALTSTIISTSPKRSRHSIQVAEDLHIMMSEPAVYMNHSCDANTRPTLNALGAYDFIATRDIQAAEELTFDYRETETEISSGFDCRCGAATCIGSLGAS